MRIVSETKDYYDMVMSTGMDLELVYVRDAVKEEFSKEKPYPLRHLDTFARYRTHSQLGHRGYTVGFCGRLYPVVEVFTEGRSPRVRKFCFNMAEVDKFVEDNFKEEEVEDYKELKNKSWKRHKWHSTSQKCFREFFAWFDDNKDKHKKLFEDHNCPVFIGDYDGDYQSKPKITWNACLKDVEFFRVKEPYTAFQEIAMWMSNQAQPRKPIPHIPDEVMVEVKGFDKKFSFRKDPSKKKK